MISRPVQVGLTVSPNGRTILYTQVDPDAGALLRDFVVDAARFERATPSL